MVGQAGVVTLVASGTSWPGEHEGCPLRTPAGHSASAPHPACFPYTPCWWHSVPKNETTACQHQAHSMKPKCTEVPPARSVQGRPGPSSSHQSSDRLFLGIADLVTREWDAPCFSGSCPPGPPCFAVTKTRAPAPI